MFSCAVSGDPLSGKGTSGFLHWFIYYVPAAVFCLCADSLSFVALRSSVCLPFSFFFLSILPDFMSFPLCFACFVQIPLPPSFCFGWLLLSLFVFPPFKSVFFFSPLSAKLSRAGTHYL
ncbi:hypothetical protein, unlikely [Trypanosoma brucei gambiense DAL972]|uniref:Uncharacterized protein n=1 Tax=Trypanosoma brucei gambiense (strain MHOM/CI/86/DAL972) TaxID=679716 RepID=C9ZSV3_TRYB9|nr:hypothetical protein, unlikely [Trypanosoma brucei gambiense DAL972]CBH12488.1 hypothetical protein, unlikely [Trypanosoma brucei gambiense DAL972]|eukprot:XP_011774768.1 hypothetical protein, unlikely [Trypanosoma brucei gambiense DAL972]